MVVEKKLLAGKGMSRHQLGRLKFLEEVGGILSGTISPKNLDLRWRIGKRRREG